MGEIKIKRIYESTEPEDGYRVLIDRIWPRGISKAKAQLDELQKNVTPSTDLRKAVHNGEISWESFDDSYSKELQENPAAYIWRDQIKKILQDKDVTLVTAAHLNSNGHPFVLKKFLEQ